MNDRGDDHAVEVNVLRVDRCPVIFASVSSRWTVLPINVKSLDAFNGDLRELEFGGRVANRAKSPPAAGFVREHASATTTSAAGTAHAAAAAATNMARAAAPASRYCWQDLAIEVGRRFPWIGRTTGSCHCAASSGANSAASASIGVELLGDEGGRPVATPCPISRCLTRTVTVLSGAMRTNGFGANELSRLPVAKSGAKPSARPAPAAILKQASSGEMDRHGAHPLMIFGRAVDAGADVMIGGAAADVAVHRARRYRRRSASTCRSNSAVADMIWPDWQ